MKYVHAFRWMVSLSVVLFFGVQATTAAELPAAPTIISPAQQSVHSTALPVITGVAPADMRIAVYINNQFNGYADTVSESQGVQSFSYTPFLSLSPGTHTVMARAEDVDNSIRSNKSKAYTFTIETEPPAPTLLDSVVDADSSWSQPWVTGVAPSGTTVNMYIDGAFNGTATASNHESGTGSFAYQPFLVLSPGTHTVTATTLVERVDGTTRMSKRSQAFSLKIAAPVQRSNTSTATTAAVNADEQVEVEQQEEKLWPEPAETEEPVQEEAEESVDEIVEEVAEEEKQGDSEPTPVEEAPEEHSEQVAESTSQESEGVVSPDGNGVAEQEEDKEVEGATGVEEDTEEDTEASTTRRKTFGWILLIAALAIFLYQLRRRKNEESQESPDVTVLSDEEAQQVKKDNEQQLEFHAPKENKNIEVIKKEEKSQSTDSSEQSSSQETNQEPKSE